MNILIVILAGLALNSYNAAEAGRPVESFDDAKAAVVQSYENRSREHGQAWYNANVNQ